MADRYDGHTRDSERSPEQIRLDIQRTRSHMDDTVEQIGHRLSPGHFVDDLWVRVQSEGAAAVGNTLKEHPIPFALVGAGLGWLMWEQARGRPGRRRSRRDSGYYPEDYDYESEQDESKIEAGVSGAAQKVKHAAESMRERSASAKESATEKISETAAGMKESITRGKETATREMKHGAQRAREGFGHMLDRNPMAVGAVAFGVGMAAGLSAPRTRWEDERIGRIARPIKEETKHVVEETTEKVKNVARDAMDAARGQVQQEREEIIHGEPLQRVVSDVKQSAKEIGEAATQAARERSQQENLTPEGMKEAARRVTERAREP